MLKPFDRVTKLCLALAVACVACTALLVLRPRPIPAEPDWALLRSWFAFHASPPPPDPAVAAIDIAPATFSTLIPAPTPTPVPTPAPPIPPNLADVLATCRIQGIAGDVVFMMDEVRRTEWEMRGSIVQPVLWRGGGPYRVRLVSIDTQNFTATFASDDAVGTVRKSLFDE